MGFWSEVEDARLIEELQAKVEKLEAENQELKNELDKEKADNMAKEFRIRNELEPRLRAEQASYDSWVSTDHSCEGNEAWESWLDQMIGMVAENPEWFDWADNTGDLDQRILYLIKAYLDGQKVGVESV